MPNSSALNRAGAPQFLLDTERAEWLWIAGENGKPGIPADFDSATEATMNITDPLVTLLGTSAASAGVTLSAEGGIDVVTAGSNDNQMILVPHEDTNACQMHPDSLTWGTDRELQFECAIKSPPIIGAATAPAIVLGLTLDASPAVMSVTSPDDFILFNFNFVDDADTTWEVVSDVGNAGPVALNTGITVVASTDYHFKIICTPDEVAHCYVNGMEFTSINYAGNIVDLIPIIGVQALDANATSALRVYGWRISRLYGPKTA